MNIPQTTACDAHGVRHLVFLIAGYDVGSTACAQVGGVRAEDVDREPGVVTCFECLEFEHGLGRGAPEIDLEAIQQSNRGKPWWEH